MDTAFTPATLPATVGGIGNKVYALTGPMPAGLSFGPGSRRSSGTPTVATTTHTCTATGSIGGVIEATFHITIIAVDPVQVKEDSKEVLKSVGQVFSWGLADAIRGRSAVGSALSAPGLSGFSQSDPESKPAFANLLDGRRRRRPPAG